MSPQNPDSPRVRRIDLSDLGEAPSQAPTPEHLITRMLPPSQQPVSSRRRAVAPPPPQGGGFNPRWVTGGIALLLIFTWTWQMASAVLDNSGQMTQPVTKTTEPPIVTGVGPHTTADPGCGLNNGYAICDAQPGQNGPQALNFVVNVAKGSPTSGGELGNAISDSDAASGVQIFENCVMNDEPGRGTGCLNQALKDMEKDTRIKPYNGVAPATAVNEYLTGKQIAGVKTLQVYGKPESDPFDCGGGQTCQYFSIQLLTWPTGDDTGKTVTLAKHYGIEYKRAAMNWVPETIVVKPAEEIPFYQTATFWPRVILWSLLWVPIVVLLVLTKMIQPQKPQQPLTSVSRRQPPTQRPGDRPRRR